MDTIDVEDRYRATSSKLKDKIGDSSVDHHDPMHDNSLGVAMRNNHNK